MKKILLALMVAVTVTSQAQILNHDFENWKWDTIYFPGASGVPPDTFEAFNPLDWTTSNSLSGADSLGGVNFVNYTYDAYSGGLAVKMVTDTIKLPLIPGFPATKLTIPGFIVSGKFPVKAESLITSGSVISPMAFLDAGQPMNQRLAKIKGYYKYAPQFIAGTNSNDTCLVWAVMRKGPKEVGHAIFKSTTNTANAYLPFEANFTYTDCDMPDTLVLFIASSVPNIAAILGGNSGLIPGSDLRVDSLSYDVLPGNYNFAPIALADIDTTTKNTPKTIQVKANDSDCNDPISNLTINVTQNPTNGSVSVSGSNAFVVYTPNNNYVGIDSFYYSINDGTNTSAPARVRVLVLDVQGINNVNQVAVSMYPVPAADVLNINYNYSGSSTLVVYDAVGKAVVRQTSAGNFASINTEPLANGVYFIQILDAKNAVLAVSKFTVSK